LLFFRRDVFFSPFQRSLPIDSEIVFPPPLGTPRLASPFMSMSGRLQAIRLPSQRYSFSAFVHFCVVEADNPDPNFFSLFHLRVPSPQVDTPFSTMEHPPSFSCSACCAGSTVLRDRTGQILSSLVLPRFRETVDYL